MLIRDDIIKQAKDFLGELKKNNFQINMAYIFGSHVNGNVSEYSDIAPAIISTTFTGIRFDDNLMIIKNSPPSYPQIETHPFVPEDFTKSNPFASEIMRTGYRIE